MLAEPESTVSEAHLRNLTVRIHTMLGPKNLVHYVAEPVFQPRLLNFGLLYVFNIFLPFVSCCVCNVLSFMYSLYLFKFWVLNRLLYVFSLLFFLFFPHVLCFLWVWVEFCLYFMTSVFILSFLGCAFSSSIAHSSDLFWRQFLLVQSRWSLAVIFY